MTAARTITHVDPNAQDDAPEAREEPLGTALDRLEAVLSQRESEIRRLKAELDLRNLYITELHEQLSEHVKTFQGLEARIQRLESAQTATMTMRIEKRY